MDETSLDVLDNPAELPEEPEPQTVPSDWVRDRETGQMRPRKRRGRPAASPPPDNLPPIQRTADEAPDAKAKGKTQRGVPRYQKGVIAAGMTRLYKRTGKIIRAMDRDIGIAVIESAEDCGQAWDELARVNPRVRAVLLKLVSGGTWGELFMAHAPIALAILMKDAIRKRIPFMRLFESAMEPDESGENAMPGFMQDMTREDIMQMMSVAQNLMPGMPIPNGVPSNG